MRSHTCAGAGGSPRAAVASASENTAHHNTQQPSHPHLTPSTPHQRSPHADESIPSYVRNHTTPHPPDGVAWRAVEGAPPISVCVCVRARQEAIPSRSARQCGNATAPPPTVVGEVYTTSTSRRSTRRPRRRRRRRRGRVGGRERVRARASPTPGWGEGWESERAWSAAPHSSLLAPPSPLLPPFLLPPPWRSAARSHRLELGGSNGRICFGQLLLRLPLEVKRALVFV